jgi:hypothetical protein
MHRHYGISAIRMLKEVVAALGANDLKIHFLESFDEALA